MTYIYALIDPVAYEVRYVGKSNDPSARLRGHKTERTGNEPKRAWLKELWNKGLKPKIQILEHCLVSVWEERESWWIKYYRKSGVSLFNIADGGRGVDCVSVATREKMSCSGRGKPNSVAHNQAISAAKMGIKRGPLTDEWKKNLSLAKAGKTRRPLSDATKLKISLALLGKKTRPMSEYVKSVLALANKGRVYTAEIRSNMSAAQVGKKHTDSHKARISLSLVGRTYSPESIERMSAARRDWWHKRSYSSNEPTAATS